MGCRTHGKAISKERSEPEKGSGSLDVDKEHKHTRRVVFITCIIIAVLIVGLGTWWSGVSWGELSWLDWLICLSLGLAVFVAMVTYVIVTPIERRWGSSLAIESVKEFLVTCAAISGTVLTAIGSAVTCPHPVLHVIFLAAFFGVFPFWEWFLAQQLLVRTQRLERTTPLEEDQCAKLSALRGKLGALGEMLFFVDGPVALSFSCFAVITILLYLGGVLCEAQSHILIAGAAALHLFSSSTAFVAVNSDLLIERDLGNYFRKQCKQTENQEAEL